MNYEESGKFGPCKLIWHHTNKQMAFEFMPDQTLLILDVERKLQQFDPHFLRKVLGRMPTPEEAESEIEYTTAMRLECMFKNPDYGEQIATRFIKRLAKSVKPKQMLLIPNYGLATEKESMVFLRAQPYNVTAKQIIFHLLPTDDMGERVRRGL